MGPRAQGGYGCDVEHERAMSHGIKGIPGLCADVIEYAIRQARYRGTERKRIKDANQARSWLRGDTCALLTTEMCCDVLGWHIGWVRDNLGDDLDDQPVPTVRRKAA